MPGGANTSANSGEAERAGGLLAGMRVRKKLIFLHTLFSLLLAGALAGAMWPAINSVVEEAELHEGRLAILSARTLLARVDAGAMAGEAASVPARASGAAHAAALEAIARTMPAGVRLFACARDARGGVRLDITNPPESTASTGAAGSASGTPARPAGALPASLAISAVSMSGPGATSGSGRLSDGAVAALWLDPVSGRGLAAAVRLAEPRGEVTRLYVLMTLALLGVYALIALSLEVLVLPRHVYGPIRAILLADRAVQEGRRDEEVIPEHQMPADELGEIMRSRNRVVRALRTHEAELARTLGELAATAGDLKRKNHLLETARRNLADADRLASLGMMSAGLAHEINTPLAVVKGLVEQLSERPDHALSADEAELLLRVVGRLERLSESLLDFARVRPPRLSPTPLAALVDEAWTLVSLDREARRVEFVNRVPGAARDGASELGASDESRSAPLFARGDASASIADGAPLLVPCDADRMLQVLVNLLRNAVDALRSVARGTERIEVWSSQSERDGRRWVTVSIADSGPGIDAGVLSRLFEPFVSTRLDSRGAGLGLAVSEGIVKEHGGVLVARNREARDGGGSVFEITLPMEASRDAARQAELAARGPEADASLDAE